MASKEWRDANLEHCRAVERARYAKNRARYRAYQDKRRAANAELVSERAKEYRRLYGISHADYMDMMKAQRGRCAICGDKSKRTLHVDHAHAVYPVKVRALLWLSAAIKYLKKHRAVPLGRKYGGR